MTVRLKMFDSAVEPSGMQVTIKRADLAKVLYEYTKDSVEYVFGDPIMRTNRIVIATPFPERGTRLGERG